MPIGRPCNDVQGIILHGSAHFVMVCGRTLLGQRHQIDSPGRAAFMMDLEPLSSGPTVTAAAAGSPPGERIKPSRAGCFAARSTATNDEKAVNKHASIQTASFFV